MKKIGIDARLYSQTGVGVYIRNLLNYLQQEDLKDLEFYVYLTSNDFAKFNFKNNHFIKKKADYHWHTFDEQIGFLKIINRDKLDLMHFTYFSYPVFYRRKFITTLHDLTPLFFKTGKSSTRSSLVYELKYFFYRLVINSQIKNSAAIITPTNAVKEQIIKHYGIRFKDKIFPVYEGINKELTLAKENQDLKKLFIEDFFIYVGNFYPHKNVERLIKAFSRTKNKYHLILVGPNDYFSTRLKTLINSLNMQKRIRFYFNPKKEDLVFFYKNAKALIHPTLSEGFGLPIVEAVYYQLPIIASNIQVFKELLGNRYLSFDPNNENEIKTQIDQFIQAKDKHSYKITMDRFSFKKMAQEILALYRSYV
jgi:glycosyltransferase involved in cell wall biosynthesis